MRSQATSLLSQAAMRLTTPSAHFSRQASRTFSSTAWKRSEDAPATKPVSQTAPKPTPRQPLSLDSIFSKSTNTDVERPRRPSSTQTTQNLVESLTGSRASIFRPPPGLHRTQNNNDLKDMREEISPYSARANYKPPHHIKVMATKHNTHITVTRPNGEPLISVSAGTLGFRKGQRSKYDACYQLAAHTFGKIQEKGFLMHMAGIEITFRGYGPGREAFTKCLLGSEGRNIQPKVTAVADATRLKHGGTRSPRARRLG